MPKSVNTAVAEQIKPVSLYPAVGESRRALIEVWVRWLGTNPAPQLVDIEACALADVVLELAAAHKASRR